MANLVDQFSKDQLISDFKVAVADAEALLKATVNIGGDKLVEVRAKAEDSLSIAKARMLDTQSEVIARTKAAAKASDIYVHNNPWRSIGVATGVGLVVGLLIGRR
ncbi:hypothetical protein GALL_113060 [mine drainage metagenome]|uniref:DUF883 domain-containing protein n=1 Tax=mine drainage metagenome TaxID=410659 RepID=A0A1J5SFK0_9ZZZZ